MKYKYLLFDADGTLFNFNLAEINAFRKTLNEIGYNYNDEYFKKYKEINNKLWNDFEKGSVSVDDLKILRFTRFLNFFKINYDDKKFSNIFLTNLGEQAIFLEDAFKIIEKLSNEYIIIIITNGLKKIQKSRFAKSGLIPFIQNIFISEEIGFAKPDKRFFDFVLDKLGNPMKNEILVIGDSLSSDIKGGQNSGIDTCWFNSDLIRNDKIETPTYEIKELKQIFDILD